MTLSTLTNIVVYTVPLSTYMFMVCAQNFLVVVVYRKDGVLFAVHTSGASPQSSALHLLTFLVAQLQFLLEWKL
jgi:hypothetical protein